MKKNLHIYSTANISQKMKFPFKEIWEIGKSSVISKRLVSLFRIFGGHVGVVFNACLLLQLFYSENNKCFAYFKNTET